MYMLGWGGSITDPETTFTPVYRNRGAGGVGYYNYGNYKDDKLDALAAQSSVEADPAKRKALIKQAFMAHNEAVHHIPLHRQFIPWAARSNVERRAPRRQLARDPVGDGEGGELTVMPDSIRHPALRCRAAKAGWRVRPAMTRRRRARRAAPPAASPNAYASIPRQAIDTPSWMRSGRASRPPAPAATNQGSRCSSVGCMSAACGARAR